MASSKTNFLFIITDQQCFDHVGYVNGAEVRTPCLDFLAREGSWYKHAYVASPICQPSRASILTGRMPSLHGVR
ncbi:MAG: sulfatase-like hydrolase/transferase, partial [Acidiferrobacterales bacterium]